MGDLDRVSVGALFIEMEDGKRYSPAPGRVFLCLTSKTAPDTVVVNLTPAETRKVIQDLTDAMQRVDQEPE